MSLLFLLIVFALLIGVLPTWPHSRNWGYYPSGGFSLVLIVLLVLLFTNRI
jgi:hypothetical protein